MAGPDTNSIKALNVDEAIGAGLAATQPVPTTTTTGAPPPIPEAQDPTGGFQSTLQVESPQWAGLPSQQDFGQVDVRRGNYNTGMVPTVNVQMPFAALANRQMALGQRKAALDKQVADFDLYSKVGSPDARYAQAFNKYATTQMDNWLRDYAMSMHGGDMRAATRDIATNPEAGRMWMNKSRELQSIADENKKWVPVIEKRLADHYAGVGIIKDTEALRDMENYLAALNDDRTPVEGQTPTDFLPKARTAVPKLQRLQYIESTILPAFKDAIKTTTGIDIDSRRVGGNIVLRSQEVKTFDDAIEATLDSDERWVDEFFDGDRKKAKEVLKAYFPTSVKDDMQFKGVNYAPEYMVSQQAPANESAVASVIRQPDAETGAARVAGSSVPGLGVITKKAGDVTLITPQRQVGKNVTPIYKEALTDNKGASIEVALPVLKYDPSKSQWEWEGKSLTETGKVEFMKVTDGTYDLNDPRNKEKLREITTNTTNFSDTKRVPASQNEAANLRMIGFRTPQEYVASILNQTPGRNVQPKEVDTLMSKKETRDLINAALSGK